MSVTAVDSAIREAAFASKAWPFVEARKIVERLKRLPNPPQQVLFETGYGPSGLPHIGTFGEVARTTMVRHAFATLSDVPSRLLCFSDDMDGLRKVPDNIPNKEVIAPHLGKQLTKIPDPFGKFESFGHHNNAMLRDFLDRFGFQYEFASSTDYYTSGQFDDALRQVAKCCDKVMAIMLPSLREERAATYSPFLPVHPETGVVMQVPIEEIKLDSDTIVWSDPDTGKRYETLITGGHCKLQWKPDWGMRWYALGVDYEMSGKDLIDSVKLANQITKALGGRPPEGFNYELFLDEQGQKISKSKGNGLTIEDWLRYASPESLQQFMFHKPREAKKLYFDVIPRNVDDYLSHASAYERQDEAQKLANPIWHIHQGEPPKTDMPVSFALLLNLVSASNAADKQVLWGFISRYAPEVSATTHPVLDEMAGYAINYFQDFVKPAKKFRAANDKERAAMQELAEQLSTMQTTDAETIQNAVYAVGKAHEFENLRDWFSALYEVLLGQSQGPRFGSFIALYGVDETRQLIADALAGKLVE